MNPDAMDLAWIGGGGSGWTIAPVWRGPLGPGWQGGAGIVVVDWIARASWTKVVGGEPATGDRRGKGEGRSVNWLVFPLPRCPPLGPLDVRAGGQAWSSPMPLCPFPQFLIRSRPLSPSQPVPSPPPSSFLPPPPSSSSLLPPSSFLLLLLLPSPFSLIHISILPPVSERAPTPISLMNPSLPPPSDRQRRSGVLDPADSVVHRPYQTVIRILDTPPTLSQSEARSPSDSASDLGPAFPTAKLASGPAISDRASDPAPLLPPPPSASQSVNE